MHKESLTIPLFYIVSHTSHKNIFTGFSTLKLIIVFHILLYLELFDPSPNYIYFLSFSNWQALRTVNSLVEVPLQINLSFVDICLMGN
jgi:hypothetical protein